MSAAPLGARRAFKKAVQRGDAQVVVSGRKGLGTVTDTIRLGAESGYEVQSQSQDGPTVTLVFRRVSNA